MKHKQTTIFPTISIFKMLLWSAIVAPILYSCNSRRMYHEPTGDTIPSSKFEPNDKMAKDNIDLQEITGILFPKYKLLNVEIIIPDSLSISADEETIMGGNYKALLQLDTLLTATFIDKISNKAQKDSCWKVKDNQFIYLKTDKTKGQYKVTFSKNSTQIEVNHLTTDLLNTTNPSAQ